MTIHEAYRVFAKEQGLEIFEVVGKVIDLDSKIDKYRIKSLRTGTIIDASKEQLIVLAARGQLSNCIVALNRQTINLRGTNGLLMTRLPIVDPVHNVVRTNLRQHWEELIMYIDSKWYRFCVSNNYRLSNIKDGHTDKIYSVSAHIDNPNKDLSISIFSMYDKDGKIEFNVPYASKPIVVKCSDSIDADKNNIDIIFKSLERSLT
ncbi:MAG: hypothetical protein IJ593_10605 [Lachnospiraceae bacterium]|nr:hypothetical protein [Lachnospiraceae bacterium]